jgi:lipopolysaccharide export system permease protein
MKRHLTRYLVSEIVPPFFFGIFTFTLVVLITKILRLIELVVTRGVPVLKIANVFALILPTFLEATIPMALLFGILLGLGRLANDQEVLGFKASGVSPTQILIPVMLIAFIAASMTLLITTWARPAASLALKRELYNIAKSRVEAGLRENVFNSDFPKILIYVEEVSPLGNALQGVLIVDRRDPVATNIVVGKVAFLLSDEESQTLSLKLFDGSVHEKRRGRSGFSQTHFSVYDFRLDLENAFSVMQKKERGPKEMSLRRLIREIHMKQQAGAKATAELMEFHQRFAFAFAPIIFGLLGVSLSMTPARSRATRSRGFAICTFWLLLYYALLSAGKALGAEGWISPVLSHWLPNMVVGISAVYLFSKVLRESPPFLQTRLEAIFGPWTRRLARLKWGNP